LCFFFVSLTKNKNVRETQGVDILASHMGVEMIYLHIDVTNDSGAEIYRKSGYIYANSHLYHEELTRSLNLHNNATLGRCHYLMYKQMGK
jgi:hypothetical protein